MNLVGDRLFGESGQAGLGPPIRFRFTIDKKTGRSCPGPPSNSDPVTRSRSLGTGLGLSLFSQF
jgi:hypothetical protein